MYSRFNRGSSVLAALLLAAFVGGIVLAIDSLNSASSPVAYSSQVAATAESGVNQQCPAGNVNVIEISSGKFTPTDKKIDCYKGLNDQQKLRDQPSTNVSGKDTECVGVKHNECEAIACTPEAYIKPGADQCVTVGKCNTDSPGECGKMLTKVNSGNFGVYSVMQDQGNLNAFSQLVKSDLGKGFDTQVAGAFNEDISSYKADIQQDTNKNQQDLQDIEKQLTDQGCNGQNPPSTCSGLQQQKSELLQASQNLQKEMDIAKATQASLDSGGAPGNEKDPTKSEWIQRGDGEWCDQYGNCKTQKEQPTEDLSKKQAPAQKTSQETFPGPSGQDKTQGSGNGLGNGLLQSLLGGLAKALGSSLNSAPRAACTTDQNTYNSQLQTYQQQMQLYNQQLQQYNYQQQYSGSGYTVVSTNPLIVQPSYGGYSSPQPVAPSQPCYTAPGTTQPVTPPVAALSCQPQTADVGQALAISFSCAGATSATGNGFSTGGSLSGSASTTLAVPPAGATAATYGLVCAGSGGSTSAQCTVNISHPSIILVANPKVVAQNASSTIGWITTSMQSCVVSSPDLPEFTAQNALNTSVNGVVITPPLQASATILLHCITLGGQSKDATTTIIVGAPSNTSGGGISVQDSTEGSTIARGNTVNISWNAPSAPSGSHIQLWLYDVGIASNVALIQEDLAASSTYAWTTPQASSACNTIFACGSDLVPGREYTIEADLYTGATSSPTYVDFGYPAQTFHISQ